MLCQFSVGGAVIPFAGLLLQERGMDYVQASRIFALSSCMLLVFPFLWGMVADRFLPIDRLFTVLNVLAVGAMAFLFSQNTYLGLLIGFLMFYSVYHPTFTLTNALCFHHLPRPREQFGSVRAWGSAGWIVPSLPIYFWLLWRPETELGFVLLIGMGAAVAMTMVTLVLPRTAMSGRSQGIDETTGEKPHYWSDLKVLLKSGNYVVILISFFLISGSFSLLTYYSPPYLASLGLERHWLGPIQCIGVVVEIAIFPFLRVLLARWGYRRCLVFGCACLVLRHLLFVYTTSVWILCLSYVLAGLLIVFYHIGASIFVNELASNSVRASAQTLLVLLGSGLGPLVTNAAAGWLMGTGEHALLPVFGLGALLAGLAGALILVRGQRFEAPSEL